MEGLFPIAVVMDPVTTSVAPHKDSNVIGSAFKLESVAASWTKPIVISGVVATTALTRDISTWAKASEKQL